MPRDILETADGVGCFGMGDGGTQRISLRIASAATIAAWVAWFVVVFRVDPATVGAVGYLLFGLTLFAAVSGTAILVGLFTRRHSADHARATRIALRQGILVGLAVVCGVLLQSRDLLTWVNLLFLIIALTFVELFTISLQRQSSSNGLET